MLFNFARLQEWVALEQNLKNINLVSGIETQALGAKKVQFKLSYVGSLDKLLQVLRGQSYQLIEHGTYYTIEKY